jgi:hypothetical protein
LLLFFSSIIHKTFFATKIGNALLQMPSHKDYRQTTKDLPATDAQINF